MELAGLSILVTGASGFLGSHLTSALLSKGAAVHAVSRAARAPTNDGVRWWQADLADLVAVRRLFESTGPNVVYHLSSLSSARTSLDLVTATLYAEVVSSVHMMTAAVENAVGCIVLPASVEESLPGEPASSPYGAAKSATREYAAMFHRTYGLPVVSARVHMGYGPGQDPGKLLPSVIRTLLDGGSPSIQSGSRELDWVYVSDVADGFVRIAETDGIGGELVEIGTGVVTSIRRLVETVRDLIDPSRAVHFGSSNDRKHERSRLPDVDTMARLTGWRSEVGLVDGLTRTINALAAPTK